MCTNKSSLNANTPLPQVIPVDGLVNFVNNNVLTGCAISHAQGSSTIVLEKAGLYKVSFNADILGTAEGVVSLRLLNNNVAVVGALASETVAVGATSNVSFETLIKVAPSCHCVKNISNIQVQLQTTAATLTNANINVVKLA